MDRLYREDVIDINVGAVSDRSDFVGAIAGSPRNVRPDVCQRRSSYPDLNEPESPSLRNGLLARTDAELAIDAAEVVLHDVDRDMEISPERVLHLRPLMLSRGSRRPRGSLSMHAGTRWRNKRCLCLV